MNFSINDIIVDFGATFGKNFFLVDVISKNAYKDGIRTDEIEYHYIICVGDRKMKQIDVKIPGNQLLPTPEDGSFAKVELVDPIVKIYYMNGNFGIKVTANSIKEVK